MALPLVCQLVLLLGACRGGAAVEEWVAVSRLAPAQHAAALGADGAAALWRRLVRHEPLGAYHIYVFRGGMHARDAAYLWFADHPATHLIAPNHPIAAHGGPHAAACRSNAGASGVRGYSPGGFSWAVDRADQHTASRPRLDGAFCAAAAGAGSHIYVLDTGVAAHDTFALPVAQDYSWFASVALDTDDTSAPPPPPWAGAPVFNISARAPGRADGGAGVFAGAEHAPDHKVGAPLRAAAGDCNGHGTHVAGLAASATYGVAPGAQVHAVQVLDCAGQGSFDSLIAGLLYVLQYGQTPAVVNLSLGAANAYSAAIAMLVGDLVGTRGISVVVSAGNAAADACSFFPAQLAEAVTVAAADDADRLAAFSNYGACVDVVASGVSVVSCLGAGADAIIRSGTSMAAPLVAGGLAVLQARHPARATDAAWLRAQLGAEARPLLVGERRGTVNALFQVSPDPDTGLRPPPAAGLPAAASPPDAPLDALLGAGLLWLVLVAGVRGL